MTAASPARLWRRNVAVGWASTIAVLVGLVGITGARAAASRLGFDPLVAGAVFGAALLALVAVGAPRGSLVRKPPSSSSLAGLGAGLTLGVAIGLALAVLALVGPAIGGTTYVPGMGRPAAPFLPWALITIVVASAEEGLLRGALFDRVERLAGLPAAITLTTVTFALMHVPVYGWHVVPLDLAVGLILVGLRVWTRGLAAPAAAHAVADLATWWL